MWILPTKGRPERCQQTLDSIAECGPSRGVVVADPGMAEAYAALRAPEDWWIWIRPKDLSVCQTLNFVFERWPDAPCYGFVTDDSVVRTRGWAPALEKAAGANGFAHSADGFRADRRMHGAVCIGGDLARALGYLAPPGLKHSFVDDSWERLARTLENSAYVPQVMVEHLHRDNGKAEDDETYRNAYSTFDDDKRAFHLWLRDEFPAAVSRCAPLVADNVERQRLMRARSRSVMIATPIARAPAAQYTFALADTVLTLERLGFSHGRQFVIGSSNLPRARNELVARFLASGCTDLLFIDDDMSWQANSVMRLLASPHPVAACVGRKRVDKPNADPEVWCARVACHGDGTGLVQDDMGFLKVARVGTGFMKISREALLAVIAAHPEWKRKGHAGMPDDVKANYYRVFAFGDDEYETGEDFLFCDAWRALGGEIWIDPDQVIGHVGEKEWAGSFSEIMERKT